MPKTIKGLARSEKGAALLVFALALSVLAGFGALVLDIGQIVLVKQRLANVADAAVLSGGKFLPEQPTAAEDRALYTSTENGIDINNATVVVSPSSHRIAVTLQETVDFGLARIFGLNSQQITVTAEAAVGSISSLRNIVPIGIQREDFLYGVSYTLKVSSDTEEIENLNGNFRAIALGGFGASIYEDNLKYGYPGCMSVNDVVVTEPGNMSGPTKKGVDYRISQDPYTSFEEATLRSTRLVLVPIIDSFDVNGRSEIRVVGFAAFYLEGVNGSAEINGRFMRYVTEGEIDESSGGAGYGLTSVQLIR